MVARHSVVVMVLAIVQMENRLVVEELSGTGGSMARPPVASADTPRETPHRQSDHYRTYIVISSVLEVFKYYLYLNIKSAKTYLS